MRERIYCTNSADCIEVVDNRPAGIRYLDVFIDGGDESTVCIVLNDDKIDKLITCLKELKNAKTESV